jgi:hypothetical protein
MLNKTGVDFKYKTIKLLPGVDIKDCVLDEVRHVQRLARTLQSGFDFGTVKQTTSMWRRTKNVVINLHYFLTDI